MLSMRVTDGTPILEANYFRDGKLARMEIFHFDPAGLVATLD